MMFSSLLVPLDGSSFSEDALPLARALALAHGAPIHLVHVARPAPDVSHRTPQDDMEWTARVTEAGESYLEGTARAIEGEGLTVRTAVLDGSVITAIDEYAKEHQVDVVVMTSHGAGGLRRWWLGSVADGLLRTGSTHLLLVRPWDETEDRPRGEQPFRHLLVPLDGSETAEAALPAAIEMMRAFAARLTLLRVVPAPMELTSIYGVPGVRMEGEGYRARKEEAKSGLEAAAARVRLAQEEGVTLQVIEEGSAADGIISGAKKAGADLIVLSGRGRGGLARLTLGSVADKVVRGTVLPVLVVRSAAAE